MLIIQTSQVTEKIQCDESLILCLALDRYSVTAVTLLISVSPATHTLTHLCYFQACASSVYSPCFYFHTYILLCNQPCCVHVLLETCLQSDLHLSTCSFNSYTADISEILDTALALRLQTNRKDCGCFNMYNIWDILFQRYKKLTICKEKDHLLIWMIGMCFLEVDLKSDTVIYLVGVGTGMEVKGLRGFSL